MTSPALPAALVWFRRDLRAEDHAALHAALAQARQVWCVFVFDRSILDPLPRADRRVAFIRDSLVDLDGQLRQLAHAHGVQGVGLVVRHGQADTELPAVAASLNVQAVFASHDDDPAALARDAEVSRRLATQGVALHTVKDHVVFERREILTATGRPYAVFTPYRNAWMKRVDADTLAPRGTAGLAGRLAPLPPDWQRPVPALDEIGFEAVDLTGLGLRPGTSGARALLADFLPRMPRYQEARDFPAVKGPSYLSVHLRFGTVSVRELARAALDRARDGCEGARTWLSELVWRDFYHQVLHHHPHVTTRSFRPAYDAIHWEEGEQADARFTAWCEGRTGYPLVDAAMAQINRTGYMHNRLRMVVASFLVKDLGLDWRRGEAYFARQLNDFDLAANNGGWQWSSSSGCDAQPWFRIFNPVSQSRRFDPQGRFIRRYLPQLAGLPDDALHAPWLARPVDLAAAGVSLGRDYPLPVVNHDQARTRTLLRYAVVRQGA